MAENNDNNSFIKRFTNRTPGGTGEGFSSKYSSQNTKERALGEKGKISELANKKTKSKEAFSESGGIKSKSRTVNEISFADATKRSRSDLIYLVVVKIVENRRGIMY